MALALACSAPVAVATRGAAAAKQQARPTRPSASRPFVPARPSVMVQRRAVVRPQAAMEVAQLAVDPGFIFGVSGVMVGITLIGLAMGFVLLRVESLAEEGKI